MKILSCNAGYFLGYQNILGGYLPPPIPSLVGDSTTEYHKIDQLTALIETEQPDVVALLEVDKGSHRTHTNGQCRTLIKSLRARGLPYTGEFANKYGTDGVVDLLPFFRHLGNAILSRTPRQTVQHYLDAGQKRLVIEAELTPDTVLFAVHLSLGARSRERQFGELAALIADRARGRDIILTGDFNTFNPTGALPSFAQRTGLDVWVPGETIPARPLDDLFVSSRTLDLFLCSPDIEVDRCAALDRQVSDHRPIVLETTAQPG